ncbi:MAG: YfiR family protein [Flavobacteriales bacterium]|nr:YfiR family protein [Flavobacteriales bacterium]
MKSMYMLNFSKYVTWPNGVIQDTFFIGVRNDDDVIRNLEEIALVKKVLGKPISVVHLEDFKQVPTLHMLYVNIDPAMDLDAIHASIADAAVLLVTEGYDLEHSMLNFVNDGEHLKYEMNKIVMGTHQLKVDETLENLAIRVIK